MENKVNLVKLLKIIWVIWVPTKNGVFNPYIVIDDHDYNSDHINDIIDLTEMGIGVRQLFLTRPYRLEGYTIT